MKTTIASKFPKSLLLGFEKGYNFIPGIRAVPINSWREAVEVKDALLKEAKKVSKDGGETTYKSIICDTGDLAYDFCEKFICDKEGVDYLDETEMKRGYKATSREFDAFFQDIVRANYTLIIISHATSKQIKENGEKYDKTIPTMTERGLLVVARLVDVIGYATKETNEETGVTKHTLTMKGNKHLEAGSRNPYLPEKIDLNYEALLDAMQEATDKILENGGEVTDEIVNHYQETEEKVDYKDLISQIGVIARILKKADKFDDYEEIKAEYIGHDKTVKECTAQQTDQLILILKDLQDYCEENDITIE